MGIYDWGSNFYNWRKPCHSYKEILPNFFIGGTGHVQDFVQKEKVEVLIPLDSLTGKIWEWGFDGEIYYYPIEDYYILPEDAEINLVQKIINYLEQGKKVAMFCLGGHGRTGYIASLVLGYEGIADPIGYLRSNYCTEAVESTEQVKAIADFMGNPELYKKYRPKSKKLQSWVYTGGSGFKGTVYSPEKSAFVNVGGEIQEVKNESQQDVQEEESLEDDLEEYSINGISPEEGAKTLGLTIDEYLEYYDNFFDYYGREPVDLMELYEGYWLRQFK